MYLDKYHDRRKIIFSYSEEFCNNKTNYFQFHILKNYVKTRPKTVHKKLLKSVLVKSIVRASVFIHDICNLSIYPVAYSLH